MIDFSKYITTPAEPDASSMIESFRAIGYSVQAAVADIVDNSISAAAKSIWVDFEWKGADTYFSVRDDGKGMNNDELIQAMRPGSRNPNEERNINDLGRFGLGLKTASFSQCRKLSVLTRKSGHKSYYWTWDLDFVSQERKWNLIQYVPAAFEKILDDTDSGTVVIWNDLDRLVKNMKEDDNLSLSRFLQIMEQTKKHLAMVFHRFIGNNRVNIYFQQRLIESWDPFLIHDAATQKFPEEPMQNNKIRIRGYVLPHKSKLTEEEFRKAEGPKGWNSQQGFYIYRNERLILAGDWLGMFRKEEHYKLARISIDLPNSLDAEWQIDIKKAIARPPAGLRDQLKAYASKVRSQAVEVYRHKGKVLQRKYASVQFQPVWLEKQKNGRRFYEINREHPLVMSMSEMLSKNAGNLNQFLRFIEETVPVSLITIKESEQPELHGQPFDGTDQELVLQTMRMMYENLKNLGKSSDQAKSIILNIEPFNLFVQLVELLN